MIHQRTFAVCISFVLFFFNDTATTEIYTLSLHDALPIVNAGEIRPRVSGTYPLEDIARAQEDFQSKRFAGKLVLLPPGEEG